MSHQGEWEYIRAIFQRYRQADRRLNGVILDEVCLNKGYHRKYGLHLRNGPPPRRRPYRSRRRRASSCGFQVPSVLTAVWEAAGYPW